MDDDTVLATVDCYKMGSEFALTPEGERIILRPDDRYEIEYTPGGRRFVTLSGEQPSVHKTKRVLVVPSLESGKTIATKWALYSEAQEQLDRLLRGAVGTEVYIHKGGGRTVAGLVISYTRTERSLTLSVRPKTGRYRYEVTTRTVHIPITGLRIIGDHANRVIIPQGSGAPSAIVFRHKGSSYSH